MNENKKKDMAMLLIKIFSVLAPMLAYFFITNAVYIICLYLVQRICENGASTMEFVFLYEKQILVIINAVSVFLAALFMMRFYLTDRKYENHVFNHKVDKQDKLGGICKYAFAAIFGIAAAVALNSIIAALHLENLSESYQNVESIQYSVPLLAGVIAYGVISPFAEELIFRGIIYNRIRTGFGLVAALVGSSLVFGAYHGNLVQFIYASFFGLCTAYCYEKYHSLSVAVVMHGAANTAVYLASANMTISGLVFHPISCMIFTTISLLCLIYLRKIQKNE